MVTCVDGVLLQTVQEHMCMQRWFSRVKETDSEGVRYSFGRCSQIETFGDCAFLFQTQMFGLPCSNHNLQHDQICKRVQKLSVDTEPHWHTCIVQKGVGAICSLQQLSTKTVARVHVRVQGTAEMQYLDSSLR